MAGKLILENEKAEDIFWGGHHMPVGEIEATTNKGILLAISPHRSEWFPKSQICLFEREDGQMYVSVPTFIFERLNNA